MFLILLSLHSLFRWLTVISLLVSIMISIRGICYRTLFSRKENFIRHSTATIAHVQLFIGILLYTKSPQTRYFFSGDTIGFGEPGFFAVIHMSLMLLAIIFITLGSAFAKRKNRPIDKYRTMLLWFCLALIMILVAIPWPFSPLAQRPLFRSF